MGEMAHDVIIVTGFRDDEMTEAHQRACDLFTYEDALRAPTCLVSDIVESAVNGYSTFFIAPDGSKEGWNTSDWGNRAREEFVAWVDDQICLYWVAVRYCDDNGPDRIVASKRSEEE